MTTDQRVMKIKENNLSSRSKFIEEYSPFVLANVSKVLNKYIRKESDEVFIVGLEAFNEAIDKYDVDKGSFLAFAKLVIKNKVIDWMRQEKKYYEIHQNVDMNQLADGSVLDEDYLLRDEVYKYKLKLANFGITFDKLVDSAPKKRQTLIKVTQLGIRISEEHDIVKKMYLSCKLPMKMITGIIKVTKKILKTHRDFIISVVVIMKEDYQMIEDHLLKEKG